MNIWSVLVFSLKERKLKSSAFYDGKPVSFFCASICGYMKINIFNIIKPSCLIQWSQALQQAPLQNSLDISRFSPPPNLTPHNWIAPLQYSLLPPLCYMSPGLFLTALGVKFAGYFYFSEAFPTTFLYWESQITDIL